MSHKKTKVSVIGFGFSGLSASWAFLRQGYEVEVFEKKDIVGGLLQTEINDFGLVESAANAILKSKSVDLMAKDFNLVWAERKKTIKNKWVFTDKPRRWPLSIKQTIKNIYPIYQLARANPKLKPMAKETVKEWGLRVFRSSVFVDQLLGPALQGVYAQPPELLSASLSLNPLFDKDRIPTEGSFAPKNGMADFFKLGLKHLESNDNFKIHMNAKKELKDLDSAIIIDTRPDYRSVSYLSITSVTLFFEENLRPKFQGFGCLFAGSKSILGVLFNTDIFADRSVPGLFSETWIVSEDYKDDRESVDDILSFREKKFNVSGRPVYFKVTSWPQGIPSYSIRHESFLQNEFKIESLMNDRKVIKIGNYTGDIGLNKILEKTVQISKREF